MAGVDGAGVGDCGRSLGSRPSRAARRRHTSLTDGGPVSGRGGGRPSGCHVWPSRSGDGRSTLCRTGCGRLSEAVPPFT